MRKKKGIQRILFTAFLVCALLVSAMPAMAQAVPDLTPTLITTPDTIDKDAAASITVTVANNGAGDAGAFDVRLYADWSPVNEYGQEIGLVATETVSSLAAGATTDVVFTWTPGETGVKVLKAVVDPADAVAEDDETNNALRQMKVVQPYAGRVIYVNETGWWIEGGEFNASSSPVEYVVRDSPYLEAGDTVFVYNGTYEVTLLHNDCLHIFKSITLKGEGADVVTFDFRHPTIGNRWNIGIQTGADGTIVEGLKIVNSTKGIGVYVPDCIVRNCVFEAASFSLAIQLGGANTTFMNNAILDAPYDLGGVEITGPNSTFINNVVLNSTGAYEAVSVEIGGCTIANNTIRNSTGAAISVFDIGSGCENNTITKNNLSSNAYVGIELYDAGSGNKIYLNNFIDNGVTATTSGTTAPAVTYWNSTSPIEYTYNGTTYTNYLGNYWGSDYTGVDADGDGIGDTPYVVPDGLGSDNYPLMAPFENYIIAEAPPVQQFALTVTVDPTGSGTVDLNPAGGTYDENAVVTLTANPATGYTFDHWSGDLSDSTNPATITMDADKSVTAHFVAVVDEKVWSTMTSPTTAELRGVWGTSGSDVFAVGKAGTILHYDGTAWSTMTSPTTTEILMGVWGTAGNDVFAVGYIKENYQGIIFHYNGTSWSKIYGPGGADTDCHGVWGTAGNDVFAVGYNGTILHYDGTDWSTMTSPTAVILRGVWGTSGSDVFAVGKAGTILHYDGTAWSKMTSPTTEELYSVWGTSGSDVFAVGDGGAIILHYDGSDWSIMTKPTQRLWGVWGTSGSDVFAVGQRGTILHYNGTEWSTMTSPTTWWLIGIWGTSGSDVFAVGYSGTILHYGGPAAVDYALTTTVDPAGSGSVKLNPAGGTYPAKTTVTLTANPAAGYAFDHWSGDLTGSANPATITMDGNKNITAHLVGRPDLTLARITLPAGIYVGEPADVTVNIANTGAGNAGAFDVELYAGSLLVGTRTVASLDKGANTDVVFTWTPSKEEAVYLRVRVDSAGAIDELNEENNDVTGSEPATVVQKAVVFFSPTGIAVEVGGSFTMGVKVTPGTSSIAGAQFDLSFDPSVVEVTGVAEGNLLKQGGANTYFQSGTVNNTEGKLTGVAGAITTPNAEVSGPGAFATITLKAKNSGTSPLTLTNVIVGNKAGVSLPVEITAASVTVTSPKTYPVTGQAVYGGDQTGKMYAAIYTDSTLETPVSSPITTTPGIDFTIPDMRQGTGYYLCAFVDSNDNGARDKTEAQGVCTFNVADAAVTGLTVWVFDPDLNTNNLPDYWEDLYGNYNNGRGIGGSDDDADHDGYSNLQELINRTDPTVENDPGGNGYNAQTDYRVTPEGWSVTRSHGYYRPGADFKVAISVGYSGDVTALGIVETIPEGWTYVSAQSTGAMSARVTDARTVEFAWLSLPVDKSGKLVNPFTFSYILRAQEEGDHVFSGAVLYRIGGGEEKRFPIPETTASRASFHSADYKPADWKINLSELLRVIQIYNVGAYHSDPLGEDGYNAGEGDYSSAPHSADYNPVDGKINIHELLRIIQIYNVGAYHVDPKGEDGFSPGE